jgi:Fe-S cluster assembly ATP-binding protein
MLEIKDLTVFVGDNRKILDNFNFKQESGKVSIVFGPNGTGKSTLLSTIAGLVPLNSGKIIFDGKDITKLPINERHDLGISFSFQNPPEIIGVKLRDMLKICLGKNHDYEFSNDELETIKRFDMERFLDRDINVHFSGGEKKRSEILQMLFMKPKLLLLDEPDSGVDVESLNLIGREINYYVRKNNASAILITHHGDIFNYIKPDTAFVLIDGAVGCCGKPDEVFKTISTKGYKACSGCTIWQE